MSQLDPILTAGRDSSSIQVLYRASSIVCLRKIFRDQNIAHHKINDERLFLTICSWISSSQLYAHHWYRWLHQYSTVYFQSSSWVVFLQLTFPATQTSSPPGCLTVPSWDSESLRGCGWDCNSPSPTKSQSGCTSHCPRPPRSGYICEHKQSVKYFGLVLLMG